MKAGEPWAGHAQAINAGSFAVGTLVSAFWGIVLAHGARIELSG